jgi:chitinase
MVSFKLSMARRIGILAMLVLLAAEVQVGSAQHCGCAEGQCCSKWGYCGTTKAYCGEGCQSGACYNKPPVSPAPTGTGVASIISDTFFNRIKAEISSACKGKAFYTYQGFITAANAFSNFGRTGTLEVRKRELAAFFANVARETGSKSLI